MAKTKSFRVAVEGDTVDGRTIERSWLTDIAATYNPATYGARVNKEHIVGLSGAEPFKAYGDVVSCSTEEIDMQLGGKTVKRLALRAEIDATDDLIALNRDRQKIYTSIEVAPNFANTGKAGLVGLAVTDTPASLGTEVLSFALKHPGLSPNLPTPKDAANIFSLGLETTFELADAQAESSGFASIGDAIKAGFATLAATFKPAPAVVTPPVVEDPKTPANDNDLAAFATKIGDQVAFAVAAAVKPANDAIAALTADFGTLKASVESTDIDPGSQRRAASGGKTYALTDC